MEERVRAAWQRIESALEDLSPGEARKLGGGSQAAEIRRLEERLGFALPADVRASLRVHGAGCGLVFEGHSLLDPAAIERELARARATDDAWPAYRVPLAGDSGAGWAIDVAEAGAPAGQVVAHVAGEVVRRKAASWAELLETRACALETGEVLGESEAGEIVIRHRRDARGADYELAAPFRFVSQAPPAPKG